MEAKMGSDLSTDFGKLVVGEREDARWTDSCGLIEGHVVCAICLEKILIQETALVKGCEHAYCLTCILRWATYTKNPSCPQCKHPFDSLNVHRSLDGWYYHLFLPSLKLICLLNSNHRPFPLYSIHDYMFEESVCLLLRATWFIPLTIEAQEDAYEEEEDLSYHYYDEHIENEDDDDDGEDEDYFTRGSSRIRICNRRWGDNGFVRDGRKEARPVNQRSTVYDEEAGPSRRPKMKKVVSDAPPTGRRAKRTMKREAEDKATVTKHHQYL